jgi:hypothetical protein
MLLSILVSMYIKMFHWSLCDQNMLLVSGKIHALIRYQLLFSSSGYLERFIGTYHSGTVTSSGRTVSFFIANK